MNKEILKYAVAVTVGFTAGAAVGVLVTNHRAKAKYEARVEEEVESVQESYKRRYKADEYETPEQAAEALNKVREVVNEAKYAGEGATKAYFEQDADDRQAEARAAAESIVASAEMDAHDVVIEHRLFEEGSVNIELPSHENPDTPYIITQEDFLDDKTWVLQSQVSLTYCKGDNTLIDDDETTVDDLDKIIGEQHLTWFGYGSEDESMLYIRNPKLEVDFEITLEERSSLEILYGEKPGDQDPSE